MPAKFDQVNAGTDYSVAATIENVYGSNGGFFQVQGNDAFCKLQSGLQGQAVFNDEVHVPQGTGVLYPGTTGIAFRNYVAGSVAVVSAAIYYPREPALIVNALGQISSTSPVSDVLGYVELAAQSTVNVAVAAAAQTVLTFPAITFDGGFVYIEFGTIYAYPFPPDATISTVTVSLWEGATEIARFARCSNEVAAQTLEVPLTGSYRFAPSAGAHTYIVKAFATTGRWIFASTGTDAAFSPTYARILSAS